MFIHEQVSNSKVEFPCNSERNKLTWWHVISFCTTFHIPKHIRYLFTRFYSLVRLFSMHNRFYQEGYEELSDLRRSSRSSVIRNSLVAYVDKKLHSGQRQTLKTPPKCIPSCVVNNCM